MTIYYVDGAAGNDSNLGTSEGVGNAWATIDHAMNTVIADDKVFIKASAIYTETFVLDTAGAAGTPIILEGYTTTPGDNGKITVDGESTRVNGCTTSLGLTYYIFKNIIFANHTSRGWISSTADAVMFVNCEFNNNGDDGVFGDNNFAFINCEFTGNTNQAIDVDANLIMVGCTVRTSTGSVQIFADSAALVYKNVVYGGSGTASGMQIGGGGIFIGNTLAGENSSGTCFNCISEADGIFIDNIIYDWGIGIDVSSSVIETAMVAAYNLVNSNTTDYDYSGDMIGYQDVTSAPAFTNEAGDDYTLDNASSAIGKALTPGGIT